MCYAEGSVDQAVNACPMCKVFPHSRCPHVRDVCRNRTHHPQIDVLFLKNAEVDLFNGCGRCKWARSNPQKPAVFNKGFPGCCRPPTQNEYRMIQVAEWTAVSTVHNIPVPPEIKTLLDGLTTGGRSSAKPTAVPPLDRKNSGGSGGGSPPTKAGIVPAKPVSSVASKPRISGSPKTPAATLSKSSTVPLPEKNSSPKRKQLDLEPSLTPRRNSSSTRSPVSSTPPSSKGLVPATSTVERRRSSTVTGTPTYKSAMPARSAAPAPRPVKKEDSLSSAASSSGSDSLSDSTVTSDGGFTDYLSDESEAELQRQAEAKAALVAQNQAEELEFKAARQQLAHVDLRPPKSWNPTNITNSTATRLTSATTKG